nr:hypothetical protein CFP56_63524 [Quercus suber]
MTATTPTTAGMLQSDHINYLILRYLQESGHENAAEALYREWHRSSEYRDPESYPFARTVRRRELISVVQQGLVHDELKASVGKRGRQFRFTTTSPEDDVVDQGSREGSRPLSRGYRNGTITMRAPDEFPTPAPKRQRRSEGSESAHVNGNMMDVDSKSNASVDADEDQEMAFPAHISDSEEVIERYDSMEIGTQTEVKDVKTSSMTWTIGKPGSNVLCNLWNPDSSLPKNALTLLTTGESLSRLHQLPDSIEGNEPLSHNDDEKIDANSSITAAAWHPTGKSFVCAFDTLRSLPDGSPLQELTIVDHSATKGHLIYPQGPRNLDPTGVITRICYSPQGDYLLALQTNMEESLITVWKTMTIVEDEHETFREPHAWKIFDLALVDAIWTQHDDANNKAVLTITTCGSSTMIWWLQDNESSQPREMSSVSSSQRFELFPASSEANSEIKETVTKILHDRPPRILARVVNEDDSDRIKISARFPGWFRTIAVPLFGDYADIAIRPSVDQQADDESPKLQALLAVAYQEGYCAIHSVSAFPSTGEEVTVEKDASTNTQRKVECWLPSGPALATAISPQGSHIAVANVDVLSIWAVDVLMRHAAETSEGDGGPKPNTTRVVLAPMVSWTRPHISRMINGEDNVDDVPQPILAWNADGQAVLLSVGNEVSPAPQETPDLLAHSNSYLHRST